MKRPIFIMLIGVIIGLPCVALAAEEEIISLASLIEEAKNNPTIEALRLRSEAAKEEIEAAYALEDPLFSLAQSGIPENFNIGQSEETFIGIEQSIPYPGKRALKREIATFDWEATRQEYRSSVLIVISEIKQTYYQLFLLYKKIDLHKEHQALLKEFVQIAQKKYARGQGSQQDILKAEIELAKRHNDLIELTNSLPSLCARINMLINRPLETPLERVEELTPRPFSFTHDAAIEEAQLSQPELKSASLMIEKSRLAKNLAQKEYRPDFTVELQYWNVHQNGNKWMAMGKMNLPWVFKKKIDAKSRKAFLEEHAALSLYTARKNETFREMKSLFTTIKSTEQLLTNYLTHLIPLANQSLQVSQINYQAGKTDFLNLIESERGLLDIQMEYYMKLTAFWEQVAKLEPLIGKDIHL
jgi:outer membrane protein TolC